MPMLPRRSLSPNSRERHLFQSDATHELRSSTTDYLLSHPLVLNLHSPCKRVVVEVAFCLTNRKPKIEDCPRCWAWLLEHQRSDKRMCQCYRPADAGNAISSLKAFFDGIQDAGIVADDTFEHLEVGRVSKRVVTQLEDEGLAVVIQEIG